MSAPDALVRDPGGPSRARGALRRSAERLFAAHGLDGVSLRQITREAGQRNTTALQYHFGNRDGLLLEVLEHHLRQVELRREALLDRYRDRYPEVLAEASGTGPGAGSRAGLGGARAEEALRELADALVMPLCAELDCADGGPEFLQIAAEVVNRSDWIYQQDSPIAVLIRSAGGWAELAQLWLTSDTAGRLHRRFAVMRFVYVEIGRRARQALPRRDDRLFASQLSDLVRALLTAPLSARTESLLHQRDG